MPLGTPTEAAIVTGGISYYHAQGLVRLRRLAADWRFSGERGMQQSSVQWFQLSLFKIIFLVRDFLPSKNM